MAMVESVGETSEITGTVATTTVEDLMTGTGDEVRSGYDAMTIRAWCWTGHLHST